MTSLAHHNSTSKEKENQAMFSTYDQYLEAGEPKHKIVCPRCQMEYWSNDGDLWKDDEGGEYNRSPVHGSWCIRCETEKALSDPLHWASMEVLATQRAIERCVREALNTEDRDRIAAEILKLILQNEDVREVAVWYLGDHYSDVYAEIEDKL